MASKYQAGCQAYMIESNRIIREVTVVSFKAGFYVVRFMDNMKSGGIQLRESRLFSTYEEAEKTLPASIKKKKGFLSPYDFGL